MGWFAKSFSSLTHPRLCKVEVELSCGLGFDKNKANGVFKVSNLSVQNWI